MPKYRIYYSALSEGSIEVEAGSVEEAEYMYYEEHMSGNLSYNTVYHLDETKCLTSEV